MNIKGKISFFLLISVIFIFLFLPTEIDAFIGKVKEDKNPKLANYFLQWTINDQETKELAKWDLLVLDMEVQKNSRANLKKLRQYNPDIIILAYISSSEIRYDILDNEYAEMRKYLLGRVIDGWWLTNDKGWKLSAWPNTHLLNITNGADSSNNHRWNTFLPEFVYREILSTGLWDGVFYDNIWHDVSWINEGNLDIDRDRVTESKEEINREWTRGVEKMLARTRDLVGNDFIIMGNGSSYNEYQPYLNGIMFENFPTPWESGGIWSGIIQSYTRIKKLNFKPHISIINSTSKKQEDYFKMRSALMSALLVGAYFSFDYDMSDHSQTWWYDEYDASLGKAKGEASRVDGEAENYPQGIWRKDFKNGAFYLNSYFEQVKVELPYRMQKISGQQDRIVNDGGLVDYLILGPTDGIILRNILKVYDVGLLNGKKYKIFNSNGKIVYENYSLENNLFSSLVRVSENKNGEINKENEITNIIDFKNDSGWERIEGTDFGQKSLVRIFNNKTNKLIGIFPVYPDEFVCGVKTAVGDVDGDGEAEIVVVPAFGGPHLRIFSFYGELKGEFFFMDKNFRGRYDLVLADVNNDNIKEILVTSY